MKTFKKLKEELIFLPSKFEPEDVVAVANQLGLKFVCLKELLKQKKEERDPNAVCPIQLLTGLNVELKEHIDVTNGDLRIVCLIAWAHLREIPNYYYLLKKMERDATK